MAVIHQAFREISLQTARQGATLVAVSKTKPISDIRELYDLGQRDFGENYVQELVEKQAQLPADIRWHFIGHLQTNKVKYIAPFIHLIHGVDSLKLLKETDKQAARNNRVIPVLLQVHIAREETKFGLDGDELRQLLESEETVRLSHIKIRGLMGMASFVNDPAILRSEFRYLRSLFEDAKKMQSATCSMEILSMGMSADYSIALEEGSTLVRIGSLLFGARQ